MLTNLNVGDIPSYIQVNEQNEMALMWSVLMADSAVTEEVMVLVSSCDFKLIEEKRKLTVIS